MIHTDAECSDPGMPVSLSPPPVNDPANVGPGFLRQGLHDWDDWYALPSSPEIEYRYCGSCSGSEERPVTGAHRGYRLAATVSAPTRGPTQVHLNPYIPDLGDPR